MCGTAAGQSSTNAEPPGVLGYCAASGSAIRTETPHFKCLQCGKLYLEAHRFEDKPICQTCAYESGVAQKLEAQRAEQARAEAERQAKEDEAKRRAEMEARAKAEEEARKREEVERQRRDEEKQRRLEAEARAKAEAAERERQRQREQEAEEKRQVQEAARRKQELLARLGISEASWAPIPAGDYLMGSPESEAERSSDERQHRVQVSAFEMLKTPVTFAMFDAYCEATGKEKLDDRDWGRGDRPVINVQYWDAVDYAEWLSKQTGWHCRLPTEAEWEYACRAGTQTPFWTGETITAEQANFNSTKEFFGEARPGYRAKTTPVDLFRANSWGLHDMHGNVWEWCASEYDEGYTGLEQRDASRDRGNGNRRVLRGGSWGNGAQLLRAAPRYWLGPGGSFNGWGFRLARI